MASEQVGSRHHECAMCMEVFISPRLLPCFHTFCLACLQRLVQNQPTPGSFPCPTCRSSIPVPEGGLEKFQVNFYVEAEVEARKPGSSRTVRVCEMCQKEPVTYKCTDCDQFACDACTAIHASIAATRSHTVLHLGGLKGSGQSQIKISRERFCATHREEKIRFFCNQCSTVVCRDCKLTSHEGHKTTDLSAKSLEAKELILKVTKVSRENLEPKLRQQQDKAREHPKKVVDKKQEVLTLLEKHAEELKQKIDQSLSQAKQKLEEDTDNLNKTVVASMETMDMELAGFLSLTEHAERVVQGECQADILELPRLMKEFFGDEESQVSGLSNPVTQHQDRVILRSCTLSSPPAKQMRRSPSAVGHQVLHKSPCRLKSFTDCKWKATVQMEDEDNMVSCIYCGHHHDKKLSNCPSCGKSSNPQSGCRNFISGFVKTTQCRKCNQTYASDLGHCPSCEVGGVLESTVQKVISDYIGHVKVSPETAEEENQGQLAGSRAKGIASRYYNPTAAQPPVNETDSVTNQIISDITTIQACLSGWQGASRTTRILF